jgi:hypothetical protein
MIWYDMVWYVVTYIQFYITMMLGRIIEQVLLLMGRIIGQLSSDVSPKKPSKWRFPKGVPPVLIH